jgi:hypothetical protein
VTTTARLPNARAARARARADRRRRRHELAAGALRGLEQIGAAQHRVERGLVAEPGRERVARRHVEVDRGGRAGRARELERGARRGERSCDTSVVTRRARATNARAARTRSGVVSEVAAGAM